MQSEYIVTLTYTDWVIIFQILSQSNNDGLNATVESLNLLGFTDSTEDGTGYLDFTAATIPVDGLGRATGPGITEITTYQQLVQLLSFKKTSSINSAKMLAKGYSDLSGNILTTLDDLPCAKTIYKITPTTKTQVYTPQAVGSQGTYFIFLGDPTKLQIGAQLFVISDDETYYHPTNFTGTVYAGFWDYTVVNGVVTAVFED